MTGGLGTERSDRSERAQRPTVRLRRSSRTTSRQRPARPGRSARWTPTRRNPTRSWSARLGGVLGEDAGEERPEAGRLGRRDERLEERPADPAAAGLGGDVDALPGDARVDPPRRVAARGRSSRGSARSGRLTHHGRRTGSRAGGSGRSGPSRAPRARAWRRRSRSPRRRCAGRPASRRPSSARCGGVAHRPTHRRLVVSRSAWQVNLVRSSVTSRPVARRSASGARRAARSGGRPRRRARGSRPSVSSRTSSRQPPSRPSRCR